MDKLMKIGKILSFKVSLLSSIIITSIFLFNITQAWSIKPHTAPEGSPAKIIACIPPDFKPTYFKDENGQAAGFIVDLLNEMADFHNVEVEWVFGANWAELIEMVKSGKADVLPSLTMSPAREKILDFTSPVEFVDIGLIVKKESNVTGFTPGLRVGTPKGSKPVKIMQEKYPQVIIAEMQSMEEMLVALLGRDIDASFVMMPNFMLVAKKAGVHDHLKELKPPLYVANRGMAVRKGNTDLLNFLNHSISIYHGTPEYEAIYAKWYGKSGSFWTVQKISMVSAFLLLFTVCFMAYWRYRSIVNLNTELLKNIAERELIEKQLREYSQQQRALLQEVNHRVKNNLTAIISMLHKEEDRADAQGMAEIKAQLQKVVSRVGGLLLVHSLLSSSKWKPLNLAELCEKIILGSLEGLLDYHAIQLSVSPSDIQVDSDQAHSLALVLNELATNTAKYGSDAGACCIAVKIDKQEEAIHLTYRDSGSGFSPEVLAGKVPQTCIGINMVTGIVGKTMGGEVNLMNDDGAAVKITFPVRLDFMDDGEYE